MTVLWRLPLPYCSSSLVGLQLYHIYHGSRLTLVACGILSAEEFAESGKRERLNLNGSSLYPLSDPYRVRAAVHAPWEPLALLAGRRLGPCR